MADDELVVAFFRVRPPCEPTQLVNALCAAVQQEDGPRSRYTMRLTPITRTAKATAAGLESVAREVLAPHFHEGQEGIKVCILPISLQNCSPAETYGG
jgi:tRNA acetyltransferase TAN1